MAVDRSRKSKAARRRKQRLGRVEHDLSDEQWIALKTAWGGCAYCGATDRPLQRDCVLALSRGGRYTLDNIAPACGPCNASKCNDEVTGWLRRRRFDERAFLVRHLEIQGALALRFAAEPNNAGAEAPETTAAPPILTLTASNNNGPGACGRSSPDVSFPELHGHDPGQDQ